MLGGFIAAFVYNFIFFAEEEEVKYEVSRQQSAIPLQKQPVQNA